MMFNELKNSNDYFIVINNKAYCFDLNKIKDICFISAKEPITDKKITDVSNLDDEDTSGGMFVSQKVIEENTYANTQLDVLMQDIVKMFIIRLLEMPDGLENGTMDISTALAFNTCIENGIIKEIKI